MASAAAVSTASTAPSLPDGSDSDAEITGKVGQLDDDEDDSPPRRTVEHGGEDELDDEQIDDDDLFGDGLEDDELEQSPKQRQLDDEELDSGDDEGRTDRLRNDEAGEDTQEEQQFNYMDADIARHAIPEPSDNELYLLKVPRFLSIDPVAWHHEKFQPPTTDHHLKGPPSSTFSTYNTALTTIRWRHSPSNPAELQSNARILRWSDGSLTLQFASDPLHQYSINGNQLAPPQHNPPKPTPTSIHTRHGRPSSTQYNTNSDSFTYLVAPYQTASILRVTNKITTGLQIVPSADSKDAALEQLQNALAAAAARGRDPEESSGITFINVNEDPEVKKMQAEAAYKEKLRQQRSREKHEQRERERANRTLGRSGLRTAGGLTVGGLEDEDGGGRARGARKSKPKSGLRRDWSDDDDYGGRRHTKEDEYDEEDGFIATSDEDEVPEDDDEDEDDGIIEAPRERHRDKARETQSPKRNRHGADEGDDDFVANVPRAKRRRVVEDEDDE
ncbi:uncharacterized protein K441DRAFT_655440 [Cenococcum geophilum 1.58]|uniref:uncharacterized protein n=1 Tax=Cenococcum geophilum 1.58 TaxID=794803 RepID=UPI00358EAAEB|nr:hypothetical protein K441DRAFT_655440 [Cenococcum geophilum 1.58]